MGGGDVILKVVCSSYLAGPEDEIKVFFLPPGYFQPSSEFHLRHRLHFSRSHHPLVISLVG